MLTELIITNFAIIDELHLDLSPGFNALTGETGAGKSIIVDAVALLLGERADALMVRAGADLAQIEGIFLLDEPLQSLINPILEREGIEGETSDMLILGREIRANGRSYCRINGRAVSLAVLGEVSQPLVDIHGQGEHLSLLRVVTHQRLLDRFGGLDAQREALAEQVGLRRATRRELDALLRDEKELARRVDQLTYQIEEISAARLKSGEEEDLIAERTRLANAERLAQLANEVCQVLYEGSEEQMSAADLLDQASRALNQLAQIDPALNANQQLAESLSIQVSELAHTVRTYRDSIEANPRRLSHVEERLALIHSLKRKYGQTIEEILTFGEQARSELERITHAEERIEQLRTEEEQLRHRVGSAALALSQARRLAAERLAAGTEAQLADLNMNGARFAVDISWADDPNGVYVEGRTLACGENGIDRVEFLVAPNPGEGLNPLARTASGGETSRLMLALKTVLAAADETPTLIFDELDQGIGGRVGAVVGRKLRGISHAASCQRQVLCVTHLPQIAGYAEAHFMVEKRVSGQRTTTYIRRLEGADRVEELAAMLGTLSEGTRRSAQEILAEAARNTGDL
jgi:DNA repair protein RecN (Recombination protein N)